MTQLSVAPAIAAFRCLTVSELQGLRQPDRKPPPKHVGAIGPSSSGTVVADMVGKPFRCDTAWSFQNNGFDKGDEGRIDPKAMDKQGYCMPRVWLPRSGKRISVPAEYLHIDTDIY